MRRTIIPVLVVLALVWAGCGGSDSEPRPITAARSATSKVVVLVMENKDYDEVIGNGDAPFTNSLARRYAYAKRYHGIGFPSLPNYLALVGGSRFNIYDNGTDYVITGVSLVDQLERAGVGWKAYMEGMPRPCYLRSRSGRYVKKHNPFVYFSRITRDRGRCRRIVPFTRLLSDLRRDRVPPFAWITPDICHDQHDCDVATGDRFLARLVPALLRARGPHGVLFLTYDEGSSPGECCRLAAGGRVPLIVAGPDVRRGFSSAAPFDHYSTLRTIEDAFGLRHLRGAACSCTRPLEPLFKFPPRLRTKGSA